MKEKQYMIWIFVYWFLYTSSFICFSRVSLCLTSSLRRLSISFSLSIGKIGRRLTSIDFFSFDTLENKIICSWNFSSIFYIPIYSTSSWNGTFNNWWTSECSNRFLRRRFWCNWTWPWSRYTIRFWNYHWTRWWWWIWIYKINRSFFIM